MTQTAATKTATGRYLGTCVACKARYRSETEVPTLSGYCTSDTHAGVVEFANDPSLARPWRPAIRWTAVKALTSKRHCSEVCTSAKSSLCSCECGGDNHGASLGLPF